MTLIIILIATTISVLLWRTSEGVKRQRRSILCLIFTGTLVMWLIDVIAAYLKDGDGLIGDAVLNDTILGIVIVAMGIVGWQITIKVSNRKLKKESRR